MINVTAAIIERDGKIFLARRSSNGSQPDKWEFPGGKIEIGETPEKCLERELWEEFEINADVRGFFAESVYHYARKSVCLIAFHVDFDDEITIMNAHKEIQWVPVDRLLEYDLAPADVPIARQLLSAKKDSQW